MGKMEEKTREEWKNHAFNPQLLINLTESLSASVVLCRNMNERNMENDVAKQAMENLQKSMSGAAEEAGLKSEEEVVDMVKELRRKGK